MSLKLSKRLPQLSSKVIQVKEGFFYAQFSTKSSYILEPKLRLKVCTEEVSFSLHLNKERKFVKKIFLREGYAVKFFFQRVS